MAILTLVRSRTALSVDTLLTYSWQWWR